MAKKDPAFLFYSKDWIEGTAEYMPEEKGIFIDLLSHQHQKQNLPIETSRLCRLVSLSEREFLPIWETIKHKFTPIDTPNGTRLVNRKLTEVMTERKDKGHKNKIIGTFASLLRQSQLNKGDYKKMKESFNVLDFIETPSDRITERLTEWYNKRLKSIGNEDGNENKDNYIVVYNKVKDNFNLNKEYEDLILLWLKYKSEKNQSYKESGLKTLITGLLKDSNNDYATAEEMIHYSMKNNYAGIFKSKSAQNTNKSHIQHDTDY